MRQDARWVYYSINAHTLDALRDSVRGFFDPARINPGRVCGPAAADIPLVLQYVD